MLLSNDLRRHGEHTEGEFADFSVRGLAGLEQGAQQFGPLLAYVEI